MKQAIQLLKTRENYLVQLKQEKEKALSKAPEGTLRICSYGNKAQYYKRNDPRDTNGVYIQEQNIRTAQELAQKDYDQKVLRATEKELSAIRKYLTACSEVNAENIYDKLHEKRKILITPILEPEEQYIHNWQTVLYEGKGFAENVPEYYSERGERVRSKSEIFIADLLYRNGIPYRYEYPIYLKGMGKIYPDFTVLNVPQRKEMYWEHLGMMDDPTYVEKALCKIDAYEQNGIFPGEKLILTYETKQNPLNPKQIVRMIEHWLRQ